MFRVGVVGLGKMGILHGGLTNFSSTMELVAIAEKSLFMRMMSKRVLKNISFYDDYKKMIDNEKLDILVITTPTQTHFEIAKYAAEHKINLFMEKPLVRNYGEAKELEAIIERNNIKAMVGFAQRYEPSFMRAHELVTSGYIGEIISFNAEMFMGDVLETNSAWRFNPKLSGGGVLIDFGIHMVDLIIWMFGDVKSVKGNAKKIYSKEVEDEFTASFELRNGVNGNFVTSWSRPEYRKASPKLIIRGEKGEIEVTNQMLVIKKEKEEVIKLTPADLYQGVYLDIAGWNFSLEIQAFSNLISHNVKDVPSVKHAAYVQKIIDAMYMSDSSNMPVEIE